MITRREFLAGGLAAAATPLCGQEKQRVYRIGLLDTITLAANQANISEFKKGLKDLGYTEGQNLHLEYRSAEARTERYPALAAELVRMKVDVIVASGTPATLAAKNAPGRVPVVAATVVDPVETGLVASLERPGANITGVAVLTKELEAKRIELLKALAPGVKRIAAFLDMGNPAIVSVWKAIEAAASALNVQAQLYDVRKPQKIAQAFEKAVAQKAEAFVVRIATLSDQDRKSVVALAAKHRLPAIYAARQYVDFGGLMSYGVNSPHMYNLAAGFVDKILKGTKPGELPMERPSKFEFIINRKTARALALVIPPDLLLRSDQVVG